jgi:hypothetical protein
MQTPLETPLEMTPENWKPIPGNERYEVSDLGRIRHCKHKRILKSDYNNGYEVVRLSGYKGTKKHHRLVALAFLPNPNSLPDVDHLNGNKRDNRLCNLEWKSKSDNMRAFYANQDQVAKRAKTQPMVFWNDEERHVFRSIGKSCAHFERSLGTMWGVAVNVREGKIKRWRNYNVKCIDLDEYNAITSQNAS